MIHDTNTGPLPVFFGRENRLFGWLHFGESLSNQSAVVICNPIGFEQVRTHATIRSLCEELAREGHTVLRFDYPSSGDSLDLSDPSAEHVSAWMASIKEAIQYVSGLANSTRTTLIGLRLGGTLANVVAEDVCVNGLILWEPSESGKHFCREMQILASTTKTKASAETTSGDIDAGGFVITEATQKSLNAVSLGKKPLAGNPPVLLLERDDIRSTGRRLTSLENQGCTVSQQVASGYKQMMLAPQDSEIPVASITVIKDWLNKQIDKSVSNESEQDGRSKMPDISPPTTNIADEISEEAIQFGPDGRLFGILTRGRTRLSENRPTLITLCGGAVPHYSANRMYVPLARRLAERGHDVFRMDLSGIGDSRPSPGGPRQVPYTSTIMADIESAMAVISETTGATEFSLFGLCSGAFAAMEMARHSKQINRIFLVNQLVYFVSDDEYTKLERGDCKAAEELDFPRNTGLPGRTIRKVLKSTGLAGALVGRYLQKYLVGGPLSQDLQNIASRDIQLIIINAEGDPAVDALMLPASRTVRRLIKSGSALLTTIPDTDHTFSSALSQTRLIETVENVLDDPRSG